VIIGAVWCVPLVAGPPLFSHDVYSYMAQGEILHLGLNPYHAAPDVLARYGQTHVLAAVSPFWRATTSPYGPLFIALSSVIMGVVGSNLILGVVLMRVLELAGLGLLAIFTPRLARALGADPSRSTWLAVISPLVLLELISAGHNDALMIGLLIAGVTLAMERRPLLGIALCAVAATIKLPAAAAIAFIAVAWARAELERGAGASRAARALALSAAAAVAALAAVSAATGLGLSWVSGAVLSAPGKVHLAITPSTAIGWSLASLLHDFGIGASYKGIASGLGTVALALTALLALALILRTRYENMVLQLGVLLLVSVFAGPATWPWYLTWGLALIACCPVGARSRALPLAVVLAAFLVKPDGILALPLDSAPFVLAVYAIAIGTAWRYRRRQGGSPAPGRVRGLPGGEQPALTNS
jgi:alpha-1,6-mannosyltransferase